jgi:hypothetical protein
VATSAFLPVVSVVKQASTSFTSSPPHGLPWPEQPTVDVDLPSIKQALAEHWQAMEALATALEHFAEEAYPKWACSVPYKHQAFVSLLATKLCGASFAKRKPSSLLEIEALISKAVKTNTPIPVRLGHGPLKNPNLGPENALPEWAEWFAMLQLAKWVQAIRFLYPPAVNIELVLDNCRACCANGAEQRTTEAYRQALQHWIEQTPLVQYIQPLQAQEVLYKSYNVNAYLPQAKAELNSYWQSEEGQAAFKQAKSNALFNIDKACRVEALQQGTLDELLSDSASYYLCLHRAEELSGLWSYQQRIPVRYGRHAGYTQLFTLCKEETALPWQGLGALRLTGKVVQGIKAYRPQLWQPFTGQGTQPTFMVMAQQVLPGKAVAPCSGLMLPVFLPVS